MLTANIAKIKNKADYITLKEAAQLSGYSSDYIGQLIRQGKIAGKQVYFNIAWVTTEDEVRRYMEHKESGRQESEIKQLFLRSKYGLSNWLFRVQPVVLFKSFVYSLLFLIILFSGLFLLANLNVADQTMTTTNNANQVKTSIEYDAQSHQQVESEIPVVP